MTEQPQPTSPAPVSDSAAAGAERPAPSSSKPLGGAVPRRFGLFRRKRPDSPEMGTTGTTAPGSASATEPRAETARIEPSKAAEPHRKTADTNINDGEHAAGHANQPAPKAESDKPVANIEPGKQPVVKVEQVKPIAITEAGKPVAKAEAGKLVAKAEADKPVTKAETGKLVAKAEADKPVTKAETGKPAGEPEGGKPSPGKAAVPRQRTTLPTDRPPGAPPDPWTAFATAPEKGPGLSRRGLRVVGRSLIHEFALTIYVACLLAVAMTWPALRYPMHTLPQDLGDPARQAWQVAWAGHSLTTNPVRLWQSNAYFPEPDSFGFGNSLIGYAVAGMIGNGPGAAILRYNVLFVLAHALLVIGAYALVRQLGARRTGAAVAAVAFAYAPWRLAQEGHLDIISAGGIPLALAMLARGHGYSLRHGFRPERRRFAWAAAGWLVATWQLSLGFSLGLPFAYVLGGFLVLLAFAGFVRNLRQPRRGARGPAAPGRPGHHGGSGVAPGTAKPEITPAETAGTTKPPTDPPPNSITAKPATEKPLPGGQPPSSTVAEPAKAQPPKDTPAHPATNQPLPTGQPPKETALQPATNQPLPGGQPPKETAFQPAAHQPLKETALQPAVNHPLQGLTTQPAMSQPMKRTTTPPAMDQPLKDSPDQPSKGPGAKPAMDLAHTDVLESPRRRGWLAFGRRPATATKSLPATPSEGRPPTPEESRPSPPEKGRPAAAARPGTKPAIGFLLINTNILGATLFAAAGILMAIPYIRNGDTGPRLEQIRFFSPPLRSLLIGPAESRIWGAAHATPRASLGWAAEMSLLPGFALYALALAGLFLSVWRLRHRLLLLTGLAVTVILTLGTSFFGGRWTYLPLFGHLPTSFDLRIPGRLMLWVTLLLAILAAGATDDFVRRAEQFAAQRIPPWPGPWLRLATLTPLILVTLEGWNSTAHPIVPAQPAAMRTVPGPMLVLPTGELTDQTVQLWSTSKFQLIANGGGSFAAQRQSDLRARMATFPDAASVQYLQSIRIRKVLLLREQAVGTAWEEAADLPVDVLNIRREDLPDAVVFHLD